MSWSRAHRSRSSPGYSTASRATVSLALPLGVRGLTIGMEGRGAPGTLQPWQCSRSSGRWGAATSPRSRSCSTWPPPSTATDLSASTSGSTSSTAGGRGSPGWWPGSRGTAIPSATPSSAARTPPETRAATTPRGRWSTSSTPTTGTPAPASAQTLVDAAIDVVRSEGGGHVHLWVPKPTEEHDRVAAAVGLSRGRELRQLRRPLPAGPAVGAGGAAVRAGRGRGGLAGGQQPGVQVAPRAGRLGPGPPAPPGVAVLVRPPGFLLHERDGKLAGFCWTKVHDDHTPPLGRDLRDRRRPRASRAWGWAVAGAGRPRLAGRPGIETAMLYVDRDNDPPCGSTSPWGSPSTTSTGLRGRRRRPGAATTRRRRSIPARR